MTKINEWVKSLIFFEMLVGMTETIRHLVRYRPITRDGQAASHRSHPTHFSVPSSYFSNPSIPR